jgi:hypothetical protein
VTVDTINTWDSEKFFEHVAMAEFVSGRKLDPGDPAAATSAAKSHAKRPLTDRQQATFDRVRDRDRMPAPATETVRDPEVGPRDTAPRLRRPLTSAQQIVLDRRRHAPPQR